MRLDPDMKELIIGGDTDVAMEALRRHAAHREPSRHLLTCRPRHCTTPLQVLRDLREMSPEVEEEEDDDTARPPIPPRRTNQTQSLLWEVAVAAAGFPFRTYRGGSWVGLHRHGIASRPTARGERRRLAWNLNP